MSSDASQYQSMALYRGERTIDGVVVTYDEISLVEVLGKVCTTLPPPA